MINAVAIIDVPDGDQAADDYPGYTYRQLLQLRSGSHYVYTKDVVGELRAETMRLRNLWERGYRLGQTHSATDVERLRSQLDEVREIYAGMDGFAPYTAAEAYCLRVIEQMANAATRNNR